MLLWDAVSGLVLSSWGCNSPGQPRITGLGTTRWDSSKHGAYVGLTKVMGYQVNREVALGIIQTRGGAWL